MNKSRPDLSPVALIRLTQPWADEPAGAVLRVARCIAEPLKDAGIAEEIVLGPTSSRSNRPTRPPAPRATRQGD